MTRDYIVDAKITQIITGKKWYEDKDVFGFTYNLLPYEDCVEGVTALPGDFFPDSKHFKNYDVWGFNHYSDNIDQSIRLLEYLHSVCNEKMMYTIRRTDSEINFYIKIYHKRSWAWVDNDWQISSSGRGKDIPMVICNAVLRLLNKSSEYFEFNNDN